MANTNVPGRLLGQPLASLTVTGDLTVDSSTLRVDSTNNRVGLGLTNPDTTLHVLSPTALTAKFQGATNAYIDFTDGSVQSRIQNSGGLFIGTETNHSVNLKTNGGTPKLTILGSGLSLIHI